MVRCSLKGPIGALVVLLSAEAAAAEDASEIRAWKDEAAALDAQMGKLYDLGPAQALMHDRYAAAGVGYSLQFSDAAGRGLFGGWHDAQFAYREARLRLYQWELAVEADKVPLATALVTLRPRAEAMRGMHRLTSRVLERQMRQSVDWALLNDRAKAIGCCGPDYRFAQALAECALRPKPRPTLLAIGASQIIPDLPDGKRPDGAALRAAAVRLVVAQLKDKKLSKAQRLDQAIALLGLLNDADATAMAEELAQVAQLYELQSRPLAPLIGSKIAPAARNAEVADRVLLRAAFLVSRDAARPETLDAMLPKAAETLRHVTQFADDVKKPLGLNSGRLRFAIAVQLLTQMPEFQARLQAGDVDARDLVSFANDLGPALGAKVAPTGPYAMQLGAAGGVISNSGEAWDLVSEATDLLPRMMAMDPTADPEYAEISRRLRSVLSTSAYVGKMLDGAVSSFVGNVPGLRSLLGLFAEDRSPSDLRLQPGDYASAGKLMAKLCP